MSAGQGTDTINAAQTRNRPDKDRTSRQERERIPVKVMRPRAMLIASVLLLLLIGLVMIYSASSVEAMTEKGDSSYYLFKQIGLLASGVVFCAVAAKIPYRFWLSRICWVPWILVVGMLAATTVAGAVGLGAQRWITLPGIGTFQPSEFAKIAVILVYASLLSKYHEGSIDVMRFALVGGAVLLVPVAMIVMQPDLGTTIILICSAILALWFGEINFKPIALALIVVVIIGVFFVVTSPYRMERVATFINPEADPLGNGYQTLNSLYAFGSGGFFGVGLGNSYQKYSYLPEAHTDFIFSIIGEELGFVGATIVVALFLVFMYAGIKIAHDAPTLQGSVIAGASCGCITLQAMLNIACAIGMFPVTGKPLPFVSYGGSSLWASLLLVGLILSVSFSWRDESARRRDDIAVIDGGVKNGGRRTSNRAASTSSRYATDASKDTRSSKGMKTGRSDASKTTFTKAASAKSASSKMTSRPASEPSSKTSKASAKTSSKTSKTSQASSKPSKTSKTSKASVSREAPAEGTERALRRRGDTMTLRQSARSHPKRDDSIELADNGRRGKDGR